MLLPSRAVRLVPLNYGVLVPLNYGVLVPLNYRVLVPRMGVLVQPLPRVRFAPDQRRQPRL